MISVLSAPWFLWAVGIAVGLPLLLITLTEWQHSLRRRGQQDGATGRGAAQLSGTAGRPVARTGGRHPDPGHRNPGLHVRDHAVVVLILLLSGIKGIAVPGRFGKRARVPSIFVDVVRFALIAVGVA